MAVWSNDSKMQTGEFKVDGSLTIVQVDEVGPALLRALHEATRVICDLRAVDEIDVAGLQLLCSAHRFAALHGKSLQLKGSGERLHELVHAVGFERGPHGSEGRNDASWWVGVA